MSPEQTSPHPSEESRVEAWTSDRVIESAPLPGANLRHYTSEAQRQTDLAQAEKSNVARAAGQLGLTSEEWLAKRTQLGRSPTARDV